MLLHQFHCFGTLPGQGNAALVVEGDRSGPAARLAFAAARPVGACVFIDADIDIDVNTHRDVDTRRHAPFRLDYYYPHLRSALCLHATLAAAHVLFARQGSDAPLTVRTALRGQLLGLLRGDDGIFIRLARQAAPAPALPAGLPAMLLGAPGLVPVSAPQVVSVGSPKLLIEVAERAVLYALRPDLAGIAAWSAQHGVSGCYVYCRLDEERYEGRNFNHLDAAREDSATGVAAGALGAHLQRPLTLLQGGATGQPCLLRTRLDGPDILVGGACEAAAPVMAEKKAEPKAEPVVPTSYEQIAGL